MEKVYPHILAFLLSLFVLVSADADIYPNVRCHPGYYKGLDRSESGEGWLVFIKEMCENKPDDCFKTCMLKYIGILDLENGADMPTEESIEHMLREFMFPEGDNDSGHKTAMKISSNCRSLAKAAAELPCDGKIEFYDCLENAMAC